MSEEKVGTENETQVDENGQAPEQTADDGEFKMKVRKLEMPVRPRGVLAE